MSNESEKNDFGATVHWLSEFLEEHGAPEVAGWSEFCTKLKTGAIPPEVKEAVAQAILANNDGAAAGVYCWFIEDREDLRKQALADKSLPPFLQPWKDHGQKSPPTETAKV